MIDLSDKSIVVCSIVRDAARQVVGNIPAIRWICAHFSWYRVIVYENDSKDNTARILQEWKASDPAVHVISEHLGIRTLPTRKEVASNPFFSQWRIEKMAMYRNRYLDYLEAQGWNPDYVMVVDLDVAGIDREGVMTSFTDACDWDVVTAFGYSLSPRLALRYHDSYALVEWGKENEVKTENEIAALSYSFATLKDRQEWVRVYSAFGGLAVYKYPALRGCRYGAEANGDSRVESRSEHVGLFHRMYERGGIRVYVNPRMRVRYQKLTWRIVLNALQRKLERIFG